MRRELLVPSIELGRIPGLEVLPDLCIAAEHEVRSVLLVAREPLERVRRVALDAASRTSVALLEILCAERFGIAPEFTVQPPDVERMLADHEAALVIGDPALRVDRERWRVHDLAGEWHALTGPPAFLTEQLAAFADLGVSDVSLIPGQDDDSSRRTLDALVEDVLPHLA